MARPRLRLALLLCAALAPGAATAAPRAYELTYYAAQGIDSDLPDLPGKIVRGDLRFEPSWFGGVGLACPKRPPPWLQALLAGVGVEQATMAVEWVAVRHWGTQDHVETGLLYALRSPYGHLSALRVRGGAGLGFSYAFGTPAYEDGPKDDPARRYRFQTFEAYELEAGIQRWPAATLVARIHHRSGAFGLVAPRQVGSNFLAVGLRFEW